MLLGKIFTNLGCFAIKMILKNHCSGRKAASTSTGLNGIGVIEGEASFFQAFIVVDSRSIH